MDNAQSKVEGILRYLGGRYTRYLPLTSLLVLLVNSNTASVAEVMTAVLWENKHAVVAGDKTFLLRSAKAKLRGQQ
jgi:C-terminal processing protease CtpA/Prc